MRQQPAPEKFRPSPLYLSLAGALLAAITAVTAVGCVRNPDAPLRPAVPSIPETGAGWAVLAEQLREERFAVDPPTIVADSWSVLTALVEDRADIGIVLSETAARSVSVDPQAVDLAQILASVPEGLIWAGAFSHSLILNLFVAPGVADRGIASIGDLQALSAEVEYRGASPLLVGDPFLPKVAERYELRISRGSLVDVLPADPPTGTIVVTLGGTGISSEALVQLADPLGAITVGVPIVAVRRDVANDYPELVELLGSGAARLRAATVRSAELGVGE